jgi:CHAD domain-containing protein
VSGGSDAGGRGHVERERKLTATDGFDLPELDHVVDGVLAVARPEQQLRATYYDTSDLRLARSGISVRFRTGEGARGRWTVKLPEGERGPSMVRREIEVVAPGRTIPEAVASLVRGHVRSALLAPVRTLSTRRRRVDLRNGEGAVLAEVADDAVSVLEGARVESSFREVEVELTSDGDEGLLEAVVARLVAAGAVDGPQTSKVARALGPRAQERPDVVVAALDPDEATLVDVLGAALAHGYTRLLRHDPGVRLGGDDEDVHQARVAARRLRSDLRTFRDLVEPSAGQRLRAELQWLGSELGVVRDADVLLARLRDQAAALGHDDAPAAAALLRRLEAERDTARAELGAVYDSDRYLALLDDLARASLRPPVVDDADAGGRAVKAVRAVVRRPWKHLEAAVEALGEQPDDAALHDVRIRAKRVRYAAEAAASVSGRSATRFAKAAARLQTVLGDLQDAVVAEAWLRRTVASARPALAPAEAFVAGRLVAAQHEAMAAARRDWPAAWDDLRAKKLRRWLG